MTTATQNTVFSYAVKAADEPEIKPERCDVGKAIHQEWADAMRNITVDTMYNVMGKGYLAYKKHQLGCILCTNHDFYLLPVMGAEGLK